VTPINFPLIEKALSSDRLNGYRLTPTDTELDILERYFWNISLCESLYAPLQSLEVALRNSLHDNITTMFGSNLSFDTVPFLRRIELDVIARAKTRLLIEGKTISGSNIIASLHFGFWTCLLDRHYHWPLDWNHLVNTAFPWAPKYQRTREKVLKPLADMRHLRNRVFHHEPIWNWSNLAQRHLELYEVIRWISPQLHDAIGLFNRFQSVYSAGSAPYRQIISQHI